jgi:hypothetical protein
MANCASTARGPLFSSISSLGRGVPHGDQQAIGVQRFLEEVESPALCRLNGGCDGSVARDHHHLRAFVERAEPGQGLEPVEAAHFHVEKDQVGLELGIDRQGLATRGGYTDFVALVVEDLAQRIAHTGLVIDHEDAGLHVPSSGNSARVA